MSARIVVQVKGTDAQRSVTLDQARAYLVGRSPSADIAINDEKASRNHCRIEHAEGGRWLVRDLGSTNKTLLNGQSVDTAYLKSGDVISIGSTRLRFSPARADAAAPTSASVAMARCLAVSKAIGRRICSTRGTVAAAITVAVFAALACWINSAGGPTASRGSERGAGESHAPVAQYPESRASLAGEVVDPALKERLAKALDPANARTSAREAAASRDRQGLDVRAGSPSPGADGRRPESGSTIGREPRRRSPVVEQPSRNPLSPAFSDSVAPAPPGKIEEEKEPLIDLGRLGVRDVRLSPSGAQAVHSQGLGTYTQRAARPVLVFEVPPVTGRRVAVHGAGARWSPDGRRIAYWDCGVCMVSPDGLHHTRLTDEEDYITWMDWAPDGQSILFLHRRGGLYSVSANGAYYRKIFPNNVVILRSRWLTIGDETRLMLVASLSNEEWVPAPLRISWRLVWIRPEGEAAFAFAARGVEPKKDPLRELWHVYGAHGNGSTVWITTSYGKTGLLDVAGGSFTIFDPEGQYPVPSPMGDWIAYAFRSGFRFSRADGTGKSEAWNLGEPLAWSPDGAWLFTLKNTSLDHKRLIAVHRERKEFADLLGEKALRAPELVRGGLGVRFWCKQDVRQWDAQEVYAEVNLEPGLARMQVLWPRRDVIEMPEAPRARPIPSSDFFDVEIRPIETWKVVRVPLRIPFTSLPAGQRTIGPQIDELRPGA